MKQLPDGPATPITFDGTSARPVWSFDGRELFYLAEHNGKNVVLRRRADGTGKESLVAEDSRWIYEAALSPDGAWVLYRTAPAISPDGRWIAYVSDETGRYEVWVRPFPDVTSGRWQVSRNGGIEPVWSPMAASSTSVRQVVSWFPPRASRGPRSA